MSNYTIFYSVTYNNFGLDHAETAWFDNRASAQEFFDAVDSADGIQTHRVSRPETVAAMQDKVARFRD